MTPRIVLDASVLVARLLPGEPRHGAARRAVDAHLAAGAFLVPDVFRLEVRAALARRNARPALRAAAAALLGSPGFHRIPMDAGLLNAAIEVAEAARLRAYDAVYVALALRESAALWTFDAELADRAAVAFPELVLSTTP